MIRLMAALAVTLFAISLSTQADAKRYKKKIQGDYPLTTQFCGDRYGPCHVGEAAGALKPDFSYRARSDSGVTFLSHPAGCPGRAFCGCGASVEIFGRSIRGLWPSTAWFKFPRASPAPGTVAVRRGHVFVLRSHISGSNWLVADYNSGQRRSRLWERSIAGYTIVSPRGASMASAE